MFGRYVPSMMYKLSYLYPSALILLLKESELMKKKEIQDIADILV